MAGLLTISQLQLGQSANGSNTFILVVPDTPDGSIRLVRGNTAAPGSWANVWTIASSGVLNAPITQVWSVKSANCTLNVADSVMANTMGGSFTANLPPTPITNDFVQIDDYAGTFSANNLIIGYNGNKIMGLSENMTVSTNYTSIKLTYIDATVGWKLT